MGAAKNILGGILHASIVVVTYIVMPYIGLSVVKSLDLGMFGAEINYARFNIDDILFYIYALGIIQAGIAFAKGSSPKYSKRKAIFSLLQFIGAGAYSYIIKYSGLSRIPIVLVNLGIEITVTFDALVFMIFGIVALNSILAIFDIIIAIKDQKAGDVISLDMEAKREAIAKAGGVVA